MNQEMLTTESIPKLFVKYSIPAVIAMIIAGIQGIIDGAFVGNFVDSNGLASVSIAGPFMQLIIGLSMIVSIGTQSHVSIKLGMNDEKQAQDTFQTFFRVIFVGALLITGLGLFFSEAVATALGADDVLLKSSAAYIQTIALFALPMCLMFYLGFLNRILGKPELYFYGSVLSLIVNVGLDYIFLVQLNLGIRGAALATGIAYVSALCVVMVPTCDRKSVFNVFKGHFSKKTIAPVLYNGCSEGINSMSAAITLFLFNRAMMGIAGADGVAAFTAINYISTFGTMLLFGISDGVGPIVSYNFGAGEHKRVKSLMRIAYSSNLFFGVGIAALLFFGGDRLVGLFIKDNPELVALAVNGGRWYAVTFVLAGFNILNSGYFTFIGKGGESVVVAASRGFVFVTLGMLVLPLFLGINGVWFSVPFAELCASSIGAYLLMYTSRQMRQAQAAHTEHVL